MWTRQRCIKHWCIRLSSLDISQLNEQAKTRQLDVRGIVADLYAYEAIHQFDIILMDAMLHFCKNDIDKETALLEHILRPVKPNGQIVIAIQESATRIKHLKKTILNSHSTFDIEEETHFIYEAFHSKFYMIAARKVSV